MKYKKLGYSELDVSEICLGTMTWGSQNTQNQAFEQMDYALSQGVNFWDTAELYPTPPTADTKHITEEIIGNWFKNTKKRSDIILATKVKGGGIPHIRNGSPLSPQDIDAALEGSLKRLKTDYIDLYQLHWPNRSTYHFANHHFSTHGHKSNQLIDEHIALLTCLDKHVKAGKIRYIGISDDTAWGVMTYLNLSATHQLPRIVSVQNEYSLLCRWYDKDLSEISQLESCGLLAWSPLATGALSGKYLDGAIPIGSRKHFQGGRNNFRSTPQADKAIQAYINLAQEYNLDVCQMAIAFVLSRPFTTSAIIGATSLNQLKNNISSSELILTPDILSKINLIWKDNAFCF